MNICTNRCACSRKLIGHIRTFGCSYAVNKINNSNSKFKRKVEQFVFGHKSTFFYDNYIINHIAFQ